MCHGIHQLLILYSLGKLLTYIVYLCCFIISTCVFDIKCNIYNSIYRDTCADFGK